MDSGIERVQQNIRNFKKRYYLDLLIRGLLLSLFILLSYYVLAVLLEHVLWLGTAFRFLLLVLFIGIATYCVFIFLKEPIRFWIAGRSMADEQSARLIGSYFPGIADRLVNFIQLTTLGKKSELAYASVRKRALEFEPVSFASVIDLKRNVQYARYLLLPALVVVTIVFINRSILTQSTHRLIHFNEKFSPQAPFDFVFDNRGWTGFMNEDFTVKLRLRGDAIPESAYLTTGNQRIKMERAGVAGEFSYTFEKLQESKTFQIEAAGYYSAAQDISLSFRPELTQLQMLLEFPSYIQRKNESLTNAGSLEVPEGTVIHWRLKTSHARKAWWGVGDTVYVMQNPDDQLFTFKKAFTEPAAYRIDLENEVSSNREQMTYRIDVIKDQYPQLSVTNFSDSVLYERIVIGGLATDDYGISALRVRFHVKGSTNLPLSDIVLPVRGTQPQQSFFLNWNLDSLRLKPGDQLEYYLETWDNDGVNGSKSVRSASYTFAVPTREHLANEISQSQRQAEETLKESITRASDLKKQIENARQELKGKQSMDWQDKKKLEDILEKKKDLDKFIQELKDQNTLLENQKKNFTEQDERLREKAEQIQKLMEELLDEETRKLLEELQKLLKENADADDLQKLLDKLSKNSKNLENELERTLELFKQLQYEYKFDQALESITKNIEKQQELQQQTQHLEKEAGQRKADEKAIEQQSQELARQQEQLKSEMEQTGQQLEELEKLAEEMGENPPPDKEAVEEIEQLQEESRQNLQNRKPGKSSESQQKAVEKMKALQQQMESMQSSMSMEMDMQNLESLKHIIHGLIKLSFDQEKLIHEFAELQPADPRFNGLAQRQLNLQDDANVLEDSLLALASRNPAMGSFVTREVTELNDHLSKTIEANRERKRQQAANEMQLSMTSLNNLALMLDSHFDMMMQMMANAKPSMKKSKQKGKQPSLGEMQQQLNNRIEQLKNSGKQGRQLSEELAQMAAEQEHIRRALQEMQEKMKQQGGDLPGGDLPDKMEDTEIDLVNKRLTDQLIQRQKEILTRLLETEKSMREQNLDEERKGETAKDYNKEIPQSVQDYLRLKEKEVELLKTVPPRLYPFYKKEVNDYFNRLRENPN
jgi:hypothetical protein